MITYGLTKTTINGARTFVYKIDKCKVGIRQVANTPLYTPKTLAVAVGGKKLTSSYSSNRKVPSYIDIYNKTTGKTILAFPFSYFNNHSSQSNYGEIYGRCQGENIDNRPDQTEWLDMVIDSNMNMICGDSNGQFASWDWTSGVVVGTSPALILRRDNVDRKLYSTAVGWGKYTTANTQTVLASDGNTIIAVVVDGKVTAQKVCDYLMENALCTDICFGDSGGSAYAYYHEENEPSSVSNDADSNRKEGDDVPYRTVKCVKGTMKNGTVYPTRANLKTNYDKTNYMIKVGDDLQFDDVKPINGRPDCYFQISGGSRPDLIGRWFAYDKDYFN